MPVRSTLIITAGAIAVAALAGFAGEITDTELAAELHASATGAITDAGGTGVVADFTSFDGSPSRHPTLSGGGALDEATRQAVANAVAAVPGMGGIRWADGTMVAERGKQVFTPMHCQDDVQALLGARTIRFEESSSTIEGGSVELLDEVAAALRPCLGSIIAVTGHTDSSGEEPRNIALSQERAAAVREALVARGIPRDGLRATGVGSSAPVEGLDPADPANRRIDFSVITTVPIQPTPIDTPSAR
ncbi:Photosystem I P700 chlorophyll a apoprotein A2 [Alteripontixanthobacter maritimus]|uniref:Photosystem I P700 chlorophyll a apoprotein A2 n=1 Tax=Alteripontixanthobacter maritimus TaxID=2161824 RepID=A0A369Q3L8_9SPHN|nr:OmpA family protein [Alteripontixanthobacter maritimus]RDC59481.1 Photosystem I P700 chlorophyll a apoprotein A2 [Alteripontixanthobacter maritimus]